LERPFNESLRTRQQLGTRLFDGPVTHRANVAHIRASVRLAAGVAHPRLHALWPALLAEAISGTTPADWTSIAPAPVVEEIAPYDSSRLFQKCYLFFVSSLRFIFACLSVSFVCRPGGADCLNRVRCNIRATKCQSRRRTSRRICISKSIEISDVTRSVLYYNKRYAQIDKAAISKINTGGNSPIHCFFPNP
jgi:hypothetical protein